MQNKLLIIIDIDPTDGQLRHVDIFFSNYCNLQSVHFELFSWTLVTAEYYLQAILVAYESDIMHEVFTNSSCCIFTCIACCIAELLG